MDFETLNSAEFSEIKEGDKCNYCEDGILVLRHGKFGDFLGCNNYPRCAGKADLPRDIGDRYWKEKYD